MRDASAPDSNTSVATPSLSATRDDAIAPVLTKGWWLPSATITKPVIGLSGVALLVGLGWLAVTHNAPPEPPPSIAPPAEAAPAPPPPEFSVEELIVRSPPHVGAPVGTPPPPPPVAAAPAAPPESEPEPPPSMDRYEVTVRIEKGDTLEKILAELSFAPAEVDKAVDALRSALRGRKPVEGKGRNAKVVQAKALARWQAPIRLPVGEAIEVTVGAPKRADGAPTLLELSIRPQVTREIALRRLDTGEYDAQARIYKVVTKLMRATGVVKGSLRASTEAAGVPPAAMLQALRAFAYDLDLQRDVKRGDRFTVVLEQAFTSDGRQVGSGRIVSAELKLSGKRTVAVHRFRPQGGADQFWLPNGQSVVKSLIRTPMDLRRVSSRFGMRRHPILGFSAMHTGTDFAAPYGTPVLAAGSGVIKQAGRNGGYGNWVLIAHDARISTGYAHLARFAPGVRPGARVRQGQVIGFVGSTGLSTGPHLHYELHTNGRPVNPITHRAAVRGALSGKDLARFRAQVAKSNRERNSAPMLVARADSDGGDAVRAKVTPIRSRARPAPGRMILEAHAIDRTETIAPAARLAKPRPAKARPAMKPRKVVKNRAAVKPITKKRPSTKSGAKKRAAVKPIVKKRPSIKSGAKKRAAAKPIVKKRPSMKSGAKKRSSVKPRKAVAAGRTGPARRAATKRRR